MSKTLMTAALAVTSSLFFAANAFAQQAPAATSNPQQPPATKAQTPATHKPAQPAVKKAPAPLVLKTDKDKLSYALGMNMGKGMRKDSVDVDPAILSRGMKDALAGGKTLMTEDEVKAAITSLQAGLRKKQEEKFQAIADANKKEGEDFLAANKNNEGVVTLPSGLQYKILKEGNGPKPTATDSVVCNYKGTLLNNTEFDSSFKRGQPATFGVSQVIRGWTEALQLMPVGSKWQLFIPSELAYGPRGSGPVIGPNSTLIFEVELLSIQEKNSIQEKKQ